MAFATPSELGDLLNVAIADEDTRAQQLLDLATDAICAEIGQAIVEVSDDSLALRGNGTRVLILPEIPVTEVASVELDGEALVEDTDYTWSAAGVLRRLGGDVWTQDAPITVVYSHGYETVPKVVRLVCLQAAARAWLNPAGATQETIGSYSVTYGGGFSSKSSTGVLLTSDEKRILDPVRP